MIDAPHPDAAEADVIPPGCTLPKRLLLQAAWSFVFIAVSVLALWPVKVFVSEALVLAPLAFLVFGLFLLAGTMKRTEKWESGLNKL